MDTKKRYIVLFFIIMTVLVAIIASSASFRFYPTHKIVKQVNCFSCHPDELNDLKEGWHIRSMNYTQNRFLYDYLSLYGNTSQPYKSLEGPCYSCHVTYKNYNMFGLTDPYVFGNSNTGLNAQYGYIINWPEQSQIGNGAVEYLGTGNVAITAELEVLSLAPSNSTIDSTMKIIFKNYSGQQTSGTVYENAGTLLQGDVQTFTIGNVAEDYFSIVLLLDGVWSNSTLSLRVSGTDKGTESFIINANSPPVIYDIPKDISGKSYFRTSGAYKAVRLDYIWSEWRNYIIGNIASSEDIETSTSNGWITGNTCSTPDALCHINQKTTYMGLSNGISRSFYTHSADYVTSKECRLCHLRQSLINKPFVGNELIPTGPTPTGPAPTITTTPGPIPTPTPTQVPEGTCYNVPGGIPSSMQQYVGNTACVSCHNPIPSTWTPCSTPTPTPTPTGPVPTTTPPTGWTLVWSDEFDGTSIDTSKWSVFDGIAAGSEKDTYFDPSMVTVSNGQLHLGVDRVSRGGKNYIGGGVDNYNGVSNGNFMTHGRWEIRARFPQGEGLSAYAALYPSGWPPEVDFAEMIGSKLSEVVFTQHWSSSDQTESYPYNVNPDLTNFHTYTVEWVGDQLNWYVDNQLITTQTQHFSDENMGFTAGAWAGSCSGWPGCPSSTSVPQYMDIDYVRIYVPQ